jgi:predicted Na+-dependent transporter
MGTKGRTGWLVRFSIALLAISLTLLGVHYLLFRDLHWLEEYIVFDLAFLPVEVIVVTLILDRLLEARERKERTIIFRGMNYED